MTGRQNEDRLRRLADRSTRADGLDRDTLHKLGVDPESLTYEYRQGDDGAGTIWQDADGKQHSEFRPASRWRRLVGPWERVG